MDTATHNHRSDDEAPDDSPDDSGHDLVAESDFDAADRFATDHASDEGLLPEVLSEADRETAESDERFESHESEPSDSPDDTTELTSDPSSDPAEPLADPDSDPARPTAPAYAMAAGAVMVGAVSAGAVALGTVAVSHGRRVATRGVGGGWTVVGILVALLVIGAAVLVPQLEENRKIRHDLDRLRVENDRLLEQHRINREFLANVAVEPTLIARLAHRQLGVLPEGSTTLQLRGMPAEPRSPFQLVAVPPTPPAEPYRPLGGDWLNPLRDERTRLYLMGGALMLFAACLILDGNRRVPRTDEPSTDDATDFLGQGIAFPREATAAPPTPADPRDPARPAREEPTYPPVSPATAAA